jgi:dienelactone hydrolase
LLLIWCLPPLSCDNRIDAEELRVYENGQLPNDSRLNGLKDLNGYFPFQVPASQPEWEARSDLLRKRVLVATGLWPMPKRTALNAVIFGKVERRGFTVEKVYFESVPGHFVTGLLFRPSDLKSGQKVAGVLCPHGHGGRLQDYGADNMDKLVESGAEKYPKSGRFPKLARCAHLARMGCSVFIFDMLGYEDSVQISRQLAHRFSKQRPELDSPERFGFFSTQAELRLISIMGLQTWNSIRALDFVAELPEVDPTRLGVTGGSGGGTQTILLGAIDSRPTVGFPNGMVSTAMQGGCTCENCSLLRIGTGNVELAALFAPRPQAMTAANDWTKDMMTKGYPQLQQLYNMLGAPDNVYCRPLLHFPHNYNYVSRATMYEWFNQHLVLGHQKTPAEEDYALLTRDETSIWDAEHPRPAGGEEHELSLTSYLSQQSDNQLAGLAPTTAADLSKFQSIVGTAFRTIIGRERPDHDDIGRTKVDKQTGAGYLFFEDKLRLEPQGEEFPIHSFYPTSTIWNGDVVIWIDGKGKAGILDDTGRPHPAVQRLLDGGASVVSADLFQQGEFLGGQQPITEQQVVSNPREFAGYTFTYNDTLFARRVHDVLTLITYVKDDEHAPKRVNLCGFNGAGPIVAAARAICGADVDRAAVDNAGFRFANLKSYRDPLFLPGAVKYGDVPALLALSAPYPLWVGGEDAMDIELATKTYAAAGAAKRLTVHQPSQAYEAAVGWLLER